MEVATISVFLAGLLTFIAPCTLPLIPAFLAYIAGDKQSSQSRLLQIAIGFCLGFSIVFIIFGLTVGFFSSTLLAYRPLLIKIGGIIITLFGLGLILEPYLKFKTVKTTGFKLRLYDQSRQFGSAVLIGASFGFGWSPCLGPILGAVLTFAATSGNMLTSAILLAVYSTGLSLPFIVLALFYNRLSRLIGNLSPRFYTYSRLIGGLLLVIIGILILLGSYSLLTDFGTNLIEDWYFNSLSNYL